MPVKLPDRKSTRLNSSHANISYAVFCLKKKKRRLFQTLERLGAERITVPVTGLGLALTLKLVLFFFNDTATTEIYALSLHDALPISYASDKVVGERVMIREPERCAKRTRAEEHTSELQSRQYLVCRLVLEKKKSNKSAKTLRQTRLEHHTDIDYVNRT